MTGLTIKLVQLHHSSNTLLYNSRTEGTGRERERERERDLDIVLEGPYHMGEGPRCRVYT
jgi:hypothetical protein